MEQLIHFILQFGNLNPNQIALIKGSGTVRELHKDDYFSAAGKIPQHVGFVMEGVVRGFYYNERGEEITRCFVNEGSLVVDYLNFEAKRISTEYLQASTYCKVIVFTKDKWDDLSKDINGWAEINLKMMNRCMYQKSRNAPVISKDATSRYLEFMDNYPTLSNRVPLGHIASFLGVTQQSLSRIRRNIR